MNAPVCRFSSLALVLGTCLLPSACAEDPRRPGEETQDDETSLDARVAEPGRDASRTVRDASLLDARRPVRPVPPAECSAGQYEGQFNCLISGLLPWVGKMSFALVEKAMGAGEFQTLQIVPGTRISGSDDSFQGEFTATLEGDFDCQTGELTGQLTDGLYVFGGTMEYQLAGPLEGSYLSDAGAGFAGKMGPLKSANFDLFGELAPAAECTWNAARVGAARDDAGL